MFSIFRHNGLERTTRYKKLWFLLFAPQHSVKTTESSLQNSPQKSAFQVKPEFALRCRIRQHSLCCAWITSILLTLLRVSGGREKSVFWVKESRMHEALYLSRGSHTKVEMVQWSRKQSAVSSNLQLDKAYNISYKTYHTHRYKQSSSIC